MGKKIRDDILFESKLRGTSDNSCNDLKKHSENILNKKEKAGRDL